MLGPVDTAAHDGSRRARVRAQLDAERGPAGIERTLGQLPRLGCSEDPTALRGKVRDGNAQLPGEMVVATPGLTHWPTGGRPAGHVPW